MKILKNIGRSNIKTIFRGREIKLPAKHSLTLDWDDEEHRALYYHLTGIFGFVIDITKRVLAEKGGEKNEDENFV